MRYLRTLALSEGISFLILLFVAMPLKYWYGSPGMVSVVGMIHGLLFVGFVIALTDFGMTRNWPWSRILLGYLSAVLPFGPFWFDRRFLTQPARN